jgi:mono/diheme cytochrome c family protein
MLAKVFLRLGIFQMHPRPVEGPTHAQPSELPTLERGRYLAEHAAYCKACHTSYDPATFTLNGPPFGGGLAEASHGEDHDMEYAPPNLTSSRFGYVGKVDEDAFLARFRAGRAHASSIMPWESFSTMTESDIRGIYRYLKTVPPVEVDTGPGYRKAGSWPEGG